MKGHCIYLSLNANIDNGNKSTKNRILRRETITKISGAGPPRQKMSSLREGNLLAGEGSIIISCQHPLVNAEPLNHEPVNGYK